MAYVKGALVATVTLCIGGFSPALADRLEDMQNQLDDLEVQSGVQSQSDALQLMQDEAAAQSRQFQQDAAQQQRFYQQQATLDRIQADGAQRLFLMQMQHDQDLADAARRQAQMDSYDPKNFVPAR